MSRVHRFQVLGSDPLQANQMLYPFSLNNLVHDPSGKDRHWFFVHRPTLLCNPNKHSNRLHDIPKECNAWRIPPMTSLTPHFILPFSMNLQTSRAESRTKRQCLPKHFAAINGRSASNQTRLLSRHLTKPPELMTLPPFSRQAHMNTFSLCRHLVSGVLFGTSQSVEDAPFIPFLRDIVGVQRSDRFRVFNDSVDLTASICPHACSDIRA